MPIRNGSAPNPLKGVRVEEVIVGRIGRELQRPECYWRSVMERFGRRTPEAA